jgi:hypothetical protein
MTLIDEITPPRHVATMTAGSLRSVPLKVPGFALGRRRKYDDNTNSGEFQL